MSKKKEPVVSDVQIIDMAVNKANEMLQLVDEFSNDPVYSLEVDPNNEYHFTDAQKLFIKNYVDFKNVAVAANLSGLSVVDAKIIYNSYTFKKEVDRISRARVQRRFMTKPLSIMQIIGYLTSLITDENVAEHEKISSMDKVKVAQVLVSLKQAAKNEQALDADFTDTDERIKELSVDAIKQLLSSEETDEAIADKETAIAALSEDKSLTPDELAYLKSLSAKELLDIVEQINTMKKK